MKFNKSRNTHTPFIEWLCLCFSAIFCSTNTKLKPHSIHFYGLSSPFPTIYNHITYIAQHFLYHFHLVTPSSLLSLSFLPLLSPIDTRVTILMVFQNCFEKLNNTTHTKLTRQRHSYFYYHFIPFNVFPSFILLTWAPSCSLVAGRYLYLYQVGCMVDHFQIQIVYNNKIHAIETN